MEIVYSGEFAGDSDSMRCLLDGFLLDLALVLVFDLALRPAHVVIVKEKLRGDVT